MTVARRHHDALYLLLAAIIALAAIGPACLVRAAQASTMPMSGTSDCEGRSTGSLASCPHRNPQHSVLAQESAERALPSPIVPAVVPMLPIVAVLVGPAVGHDTPSGPGPLISPLRL